MAENFPNLGKETDIPVQESQRIPKKMNPKRSTPRHIIIKMEKVKEKILKVAKEKQLVTYKGKLSAEVLAKFATQKWVARYI